MSSLGEVRSYVALLRNDGPHTIQHIIWIWWGITSDGKRIPMGNQTTVGPGGIKPGEFAIAAPSFPLTSVLTQRGKQPRANLSGLPAAVQ